MEADEKNDGHEAIYYEDDCKAWLHRKCTGLTHQAFTKLTKCGFLYFCVYCTLEIRSKDITAHQELIEVLTNKLNV